MTGLTLEEITSYWSAKILQDSSELEIDQLEHVEMPAHLKNYVLEHGKLLFNKEISRILSSPYFDLAHRTDTEQDLKESLSKFLMDRMILPESSIREMVIDVYQKLLDEWEIAPLSMRQASDSPNVLAKSIFERISTIVPVYESDTQTHDIDVLSQICDASGLTLLASAVKLESQLEASELTLEEFIKIIRRLIMLKDHFKVSGKMVSAEGLPTIKVGEIAVEEAEEVVIELPIEEPADVSSGPVLQDSEESDSAAPEELSASESDLEELPEQTQFHKMPDVEELPEPIAEPVAEPTPTSTLINEPEESQAMEEPDKSEESVVTASVDTGDRSPFLSPELTTSHDAGNGNAAPEPDINSEVTPPDPPEPSSDLTESGLFMFSLLMHPQKRAYLGNKLFDDDFESYDRMVNKISMQKSIDHALVIADNELYIHDISVTAISAAELLRTIKTYFGETDYKD